MVDYLAELYAAGLAHAAVYCHSFVYVSITRSSPGARLVELFLIQSVHTPGVYIPPAHLHQRLLCRRRLMLYEEGAALCGRVLMLLF
jgi:hypothetical protein